MVNDFFLQATIDFLLGNVTALVFDEFETNMMTKDPAVSVQRMREQAIEQCQKRVISDEKEEFIGGWIFHSPAVIDSLTATPLQEVVFLLTDTALYLCRFDWNLDKVSSFDRVDLAHVTSIKYGTYITSTISSTQTDETKNIGLVVTYQPGSSDVRRVNTRSLSSVKNGNNGNGPGVQDRLTGLINRKTATGNDAPSQPQLPTKKIALKAPYSSSSSSADTRSGTKMSEAALVTTVCHEIERLAFLNQPVSGTAEAKRETLIEEGEVVSLAEARKNVGIFETLGHSIKKLVWA